MADTDPIQPVHEPAVPFLDEEAAWVHDAADRFEEAPATLVVGAVASIPAETAALAAPFAASPHFA